MKTTERRTITGHHAIRIAQRDGVTLHKYEDITDPQSNLSIREAFIIAAENAGLIYCTVVPRGEMPEGYAVECYFRDGKYLGPDEDGIEPRWEDAEQAE